MATRASTNPFRKSLSGNTYASTEHDDNNNNLVLSHSLFDPPPASSSILRDRQYKPSDDSSPPLDKRPSSRLKSSKDVKSQSPLIERRPTPALASLDGDFSGSNLPSRGSSSAQALAWHGDASTSTDLLKNHYTSSTGKLDQENPFSTTLPPSLYQLGDGAGNTEVANVRARAAQGHLDVRAFKNLLLSGNSSIRAGSPVRGNSPRPTTVSRASYETSSSNASEPLPPISRDSNSRSDPSEPDEDSDSAPQENPLQHRSSIPSELRPPHQLDHDSISPSPLPSSLKKQKPPPPPPPPTRYGRQFKPELRGGSVPQESTLKLRFTQVLNKPLPPAPAYAPGGSSDNDSVFYHETAVTNVAEVSLASPVLSPALSPALSPPPLLSRGHPRTDVDAEDRVSRRPSFESIRSRADSIISFVGAPLSKNPEPLQRRQSRTDITRAFAASSTNTGPHSPADEASGRRSSVESTRSRADSLSIRPAPPPPRRSHQSRKSATPLGSPVGLSLNLAASAIAAMDAETSPIKSPPVVAPSLMSPVPARESCNHTDVGGKASGGVNPPPPPPSRRSSIRRSTALPGSAPRVLDKEKERQERQERQERPEHQDGRDKGDMPPPPLPRYKGANRWGEDNIITRSTSGESTKIMEDVAEEPPAFEARPGSTASDKMPGKSYVNSGEGANILADLHALQKEVDALRGTYQSQSRDAVA